jgi:hypothetical protein
LTDYRSQLLDTMLVERATWTAAAPLQRIGETIIAAPGYIWLRFWLLESEEVLEKYFDQNRRSLGFYLPICMPIVRRGARFQSKPLWLGMWLQPNGRLVVLGEDAFEEAAAAGELSPVEVEHAEFRIRALSLEIHQKRYPPGMVRTFGLAEEAKK